VSVRVLHQGPQHLRRCAPVRQGARLRLLGVGDDIVAGVLEWLSGPQRALRCHRMVLPPTSAFTARRRQSV
jgi:hypothetical protein